MASTTQPAVSFDEIIQAERQRKKNADLANQLLGKNRKADAPSSVNETNEALANRILTRHRRPGVQSSAGGSQKEVAAPRSQASKTGVAKRSASHPRFYHDNRAARAIGISIKGKSSGPFVVVGSNFAPGTTAADIQSALEPVSGKMLSCWITSQHPTVTAEMQFAEKSGADIVIANFHNQKADGRVLSMHLKLTSGMTHPRSKRSYNGLREQADRERRRNRRADPQIEDGNYGFVDDQGSGLYSDELLAGGPNQSARHRAQWH